MQFLVQSLIIWLNSTYSYTNYLSPTPVESTTVLRIDVRELVISIQLALALPLSFAPNLPHSDLTFVAAYYCVHAPRRLPVSHLNYSYYFPFAHTICAMRLYSIIDADGEVYMLIGIDNNPTTICLTYRFDMKANKPCGL